MTMKTIAIFNHKGGVGKTTTVVNLAACLAHLHSLRVLVIDLDPQANATRALFPADLPEGTATVKDCLTSGRSLAEVVIPTAIEQLYVAPADITLSEATFASSTRPNREHLLHAALQPVKNNYDFILIDCPPSLGPLAVNAMAAADAVIIPCEAQYLSLRGLSHVLELVQLVRVKLNPRMHVLGVLATKFHVLSLANQEVLRHMRDNSRCRLFSTVIPRDVKAEEAPSHGMPLILYAPESRVTQAYCQLTEEVITRCRN